MSERTDQEENQGLLLPGLDGTNPLGFLAALGLLRSVNEPDYSLRVQMQWVPSGGTWVPRIVGTQWDEPSLLDLLKANLASQIKQHSVSLLAELATDDADKRSGMFWRIADGARFDCRSEVDWLAALASDLAAPSAVNQLQTARRDYYYGNLSSVISQTTTEHVRRALFSPWDYADPLHNQSLHLDPSEDRRHAHQWNKPAGDPDRKRAGGMLGANRLAIEALPFFTSFPAGDALRTTGFTGQRSFNTRWSWPIWNAALAAPTVSSMLAMAELQQDPISAEAQARLRYRGIAAVFRTRRILVGNTPNFTPACQVA